jgi:hypothetical protein
MVFNATFNNISVILWMSVLLVEETGGPVKTTDLSQFTDKFYHIMGGHRDRDRMVVGFTTYAVSAYHH